MVAPTRPPANGFVAAARKIYNPVGFSKGYNFVLWFIFAGAMTGFCLARLQYIDLYGIMCNPDSTTGGAAPGECFYYLQYFYGIGIRLHLIGILPAGLLAVVQFTPIVRYKATLLHRINGYLVILLSLVGCAGAIMILPMAFGGSFDIQVLGGALTIMFVGSLVMAYINIKRLQIEQHRIWMLRAWILAGSIITSRIIMILAVMIVPAYRYSTSMPCDKLNWLMESQNETLAAYPECEPFFTGENPNQFASVGANFQDPKNVAEVASIFNWAFSGSVWLAVTLHAIGAEIYIHLTPAEHERLRQVSYKRQLEAGMRHPGRAGLTADRLGDSEKWTPPSGTMASMQTDAGKEATLENPETPEERSDIELGSNH